MSGSDASIYNLIRPVPITPYVPAEERELQRVRLRSLLGAEEMQRLQMDEARRGMESSRRLQDFFSTNPNATPEQVAPIDYRAAEALRKARLEEEGKRATIGKDKATAEKTRIEGMAALAKQGRDLIAAATPETLPSVLEWGAQNNQQWALKAPPQIMSDPQAFAQWQRQNVLGADEWLKRNAPTIAEQNVVRGQDLTDARTRAEGAANRAVTMRGQNLADARAREAAATGRIPPGYRATADGGLEAIPGGPADEKEAKKIGDTKKVVDMYVAARDGVMSGLEETFTGPILGRAIPFTAKQQTAEGAVAAMAPVLKQLFRVSGEGVFTDRDQALLLDMVPKRSDEPEARKAKMANIDKIVAAKLGMEVPSAQQAAGKIGEKPVRIAGDDGYNALPKGALYVGPDGVTRRK